MKLPPPFYKTAHQIGALLLAFWLGGFACLLTCSPEVLADSSTSSCNLSEQKKKEPVSQKFVRSENSVHCDMQGDMQGDMQAQAGISTNCCKKPARQSKRIKSGCTISTGSTGNSAKFAVKTPQQFASYKESFYKKIPIATSQSLPASCGMSCCPFSRNLAEPVRTSSTNIQANEQSLNKTLFEPILERVNPGFSNPLQLPNRGDTYLHCCVFLI